MNEKQIDDAFNAIYEVARSLERKFESQSNAQDIKDGLELIIALTKYRFDIRSGNDKERFSKNDA